MSKRAVFGAALLAWTAIGFATIATEAASGWRNRDSYVAGTATWRFGTRQPERLQRCLTSALELIPPGSRVAVAGKRPDIYLWRWSAYFLPAWDVVPAPASGPVEADYLVGFGTDWPDGERLRGGRWCGVYRLP